LDGHRRTSGATPVDISGFSLNFAPGTLIRNGVNTLFLAPQAYRFVLLPAISLDAKLENAA
jgi:hypothetical protein